MRKLIKKKKKDSGFTRVWNLVSTSLASNLCLKQITGIVT